MLWEVYREIRYSIITFIETKMLWEFYGEIRYSIITFIETKKKKPQLFHSAEVYHADSYLNDFRDLLS